jgi:hypothetical protein
VICIAVVTDLWTRSYADSFDTFGDHEKLSGHVVLAAGNVSDFSPAQFSLDGSLQLQKARVYRIATVVSRRVV